MKNITPVLWFDNQAEEAINFYLSIFKDSEAGDLIRVPTADPQNPYKVLSGSFVLNGQRFMFVNGGPQFQFTEAVSFFIECKDQAEVDYYWDRLSEGGSDQNCGWLKDKFGLSWQIVPQILLQYLRDPDPVKSQRVMQAMLQMVKLEVSELEKAYLGN